MHRPIPDLNKDGVHMKRTLDLNQHGSTTSQHCHFTICSYRSHLKHYRRLPCHQMSATHSYVQLVSAKGLLLCLHDD